MSLETFKNQVGWHPDSLITNYTSDPDYLDLTRYEYRTAERILLGEQESGN